MHGALVAGANDCPITADVGIAAELWAAIVGALVAIVGLLAAIVGLLAAFCCKSWGCKSLA